LFAAPVIISIIIAFVVYLNNQKNKGIAIGIIGVGAIAGVWLAEYIRRKHGLANFFSSLYSNEVDKKPS
jgi:hypothetical protein